MDGWDEKEVRVSLGMLGRDTWSQVTLDKKGCPKSRTLRRTAIGRRSNSSSLVTPIISLKFFRRDGPGIRGPAGTEVSLDEYGRPANSANISPRLGRFELIFEGMDRERAAEV